PLQLGTAGMDRFLNGGQDHVDDGDAEQGHEEWHQCQGQYPLLFCVEFSGQICRHISYFYSHLQDASMSPSTWEVTILSKITADNAHGELSGHGSDIAVDLYISGSSQFGV